MLKLRFSKPSVKTYMDGRITVCKYGCTVINNTTKKIVEEFNATGIAKCAPTDNVDEAYGRKLADSRAKLNAYKAASNFLSPGEFDALLDEVIFKTELIEFIESMRYLKDKEALHIEFIKDELN